MILYVEGPRASGKTYLIREFIKSCNKPNVEYYKFYFANHVNTLNLKHLEGTPALHYFSLGNILTIMEMNLLPENSNKVWVFDRAIISAYVWAQQLGRLTEDQARSEFMTLISSNLYYNSKTLLVQPTVDRSSVDSTRKKDQFDGLFSTEDELSQMSNFLQSGMKQMTDSSKNNQAISVFNNFDKASVYSFIDSCNLLLQNQSNK